MKKTIQSRITLVLISALALIAIIGTVSLYYFYQISLDIEQVIKRDITAERSAEKLKSYFLDLENTEKIFIGILKAGEEPISLEKPIEELKSVIVQHQQISTIEENKKHLSLLLDYLKKYSLSIQELSAMEVKPNKEELTEWEKTLSLLTENMHITINDILALRYKEVATHQSDIELLISNARRNMLLLVFVVIGGGIILTILTPKRVTAPINRYIAGIQKVEELNFDISLPTSGEGEMAQLGKAINRMIDRFRTFDEIKRKRIRFEKSKQRVLANMFDLGVIMLAIEGEVLFLNAQLAKILDFDSDDYQGKDFHTVDLPAELKEMISEVLEKKERVDSRMMIFHYRDDGKEKKAVEVLVDAGLVRNYQGVVVNIIITFEDITNPPGQSVFKRISIIDQKLI